MATIELCLVFVDSEKQMTILLLSMLQFVYFPKIMVLVYGKFIVLFCD